MLRGPSSKLWLSSTCRALLGDSGHRAIKATSHVAAMIGSFLSVAPAHALSRCAGTAPVTIAIQPDFAHPGTRFEGWGTALAWFANVTGYYPEPVRGRLADLLYGPDGLGWTIARYNIGGGNAADTPEYLRAGAAVPGFWRQPAGTTGNDWWNPDSPAMWDWSADAGQRWWLDAIRDRVPSDVRIFEAFSNSPPWFMTVSGRVSGAERAEVDNLRPGQERLFADYLARSVQELERRHRIAFRTLSPINEPNTPYWFAANTQEGAYWSPQAQARMIVAADQALRRRGLATRIAAMDETNSQTFVLDWQAYPPEARAAIDQLNVHGYDTRGQTGVRDISVVSGKRLWMSEVDLSAPNAAENFEDRRSALALGIQIVADLKQLEPSAWVFWQAIENLSGRGPGTGSNWGLIKMDLKAKPADRHDVSITSKYWAMANFSRYIRPGWQLVRVPDLDTVAAIAPDRSEAVVVHVNNGASPRRLSIDGRWAVTAVVSDAEHRAEPVCHNPVADDVAVVSPPLSVTTLRLSRAQATGVEPQKMR